MQRVMRRMRLRRWHAVSVLMKMRSVAGRTVKLLLTIASIGRALKKAIN